MPDAGSARCDFPGGDAATLCRSIRHLFATLPDETHACSSATTTVSADASHSAETTIDE